MNDQERLLTIFLRLQAGAHLTKSQLADEFGLDPKTIQRDFSRLSDFMDTQPMIAGELAYDAKHHTRYLKGKSLFNKKDILIIAKILLENRALNKEENKGLLDSLLALIAKEERQEVQAIIMASSQFFSQRKTIKPPAMLVAYKAFSFHLFFLYNLIVQAK